MFSHALYRLRQRWFRSTAHSATFARFSLVAVGASVVDIGGLYALNLGLGLNVYTGRVFSFGAATALAYTINRWFTFADVTNPSGRPGPRSRFFGVFGIGALLNYSVFTAIVMLGPGAGLPYAATLWFPLIGIWIGGLVGMSFNYVLSCQLVFERR